MHKPRKTCSPLVLAALVLCVAPFLYVLSFGPACWFASSTGVAYPDVRSSRILRVYWPVGWCAETWGWENTLGSTVDWYGRLFLPSGGSVGLPVASHGHTWRPILK